MKPQGTVPLYVCLILTLVNIEHSFGATNDHINLIETGNSDLFRLKNLQRRFLDLVGNSTQGLHDFQDLIGIFHSDAGDELGRVFLEGFLVGATQDDSIGILTDFWGELQHRLPAHLVRTIRGYGSFFEGLDASTFALTVEKLFEKDFLGNSLAGIPLGQLVDMVQPVASKYGIDIKLVINSLLGNGDNNVRDIIINSIKSMDIPSLIGTIFGNSTSKSHTAIQDKTGTYTKEKPYKTKPNKNNSPLQLFKPLIANLLKENGLELDADAVIDVVSPLLNADMLGQLVPLLTSMMGGKSGGAAALLPLLSGMMGGGGGGGQKNAGAMLGGLGALMGGMGGEKGKMDPLALLSMASMFMGNGEQKKAKPSNVNNQKKARNENNLNIGSIVSMASQMAGNNNLDMGSLLNVASAFMGNSNNKKPKATDKIENNLDMGSLLNVASAFMGNSNNKKPKATDKIERKPSTNKPTSKPSTDRPVSKPSTTHKPVSKPSTEKPASKTASPPKDHKDTKKNKNLIDIFEPVLLSMQTDKQCNKKISDAIRFGKAVLSKKMVSISELGKMLPSLVSSVMDGNAINTGGLDIPSMMGAMQQAFKTTDWKELLNSMENEDFRQTLFRTITPHISELLMLLSSDDVQQNLYNLIVPKVDGFFSGYGLAGLTIENFPGRIGPMLGMFSRGWNLPFNPTTLLVPLKEYVIGIRKWAKSSLEDVKQMKKDEVSLAVMKALEKDLSESILSVLDITSKTKPHCLPQLLCELNQNNDDTLKAATTRAASIVLGGAPILETSDAKLLLEIIQAAKSSDESCKVRFPGKCNTLMEKDSSRMETNYEYHNQIHEDL